MNIAKTHRTIRIQSYQYQHRPFVSQAAYDISYRAIPCRVKVFHLFNVLYYTEFQQ
jgi:hypothetical protein